LLVYNVIFIVGPNRLGPERLGPKRLGAELVWGQIDLIPNRLARYNIFEANMSIVNQARSYAEARKHVLPHHFDSKKKRERERERTIAENK
jgi:hypothetical protein